MTAECLGTCKEEQAIFWSSWISRISTISYRVSEWHVNFFMKNLFIFKERIYNSYKISLARTELIAKSFSLIYLLTCERIHAKSDAVALSLMSYYSSYNHFNHLQSLWFKQILSETWLNLDGKKRWKGLEWTEERNMLSFPFTFMS